MLTEILDVRQIEGEPARRWFSDDYFDLIVWTLPDGSVHGFQLCYDVGRRERALTWRRGRGYSHDRVDDGDTRAPFKRTPVLVADGTVDHASLIEAFRSRSGAIDPAVRELVLEQLRRYPERPAEPAAEAPPSDDPLARALRQVLAGRMEFGCSRAMRLGRHALALVCGFGALLFGSFFLFGAPAGLAFLGKPALLAISGALAGLTLALHSTLGSLAERYVLTPEHILVRYPDGGRLRLRWHDIVRERDRPLLHRYELCGAEPEVVLPLSKRTCGFPLMRQLIAELRERSGPPQDPAPEQDAGAAQDRLVAALREPACYAHPVREVRHLETHISHLLLTGDFAYKIKKPLDLGFLDFSTLERRRFCCEEEIRLNRRLAPDIYLEVVAITGSPQAPRMGGEGAALEYAVRMVQFDPDDTLDHVLARGALAEADMAEIAALVADFHAACARGETGLSLGTPEAVRAPVLANFEALRGLLDESALPALAELERQEAAAFERHAALMARRAADGFVRECHGDLHLANMARHEGRILAFDCIEFSEPLRWVDVMSELAFLLMDLRHRGRPDFARLVLDGYLERTGDFEGVALLPYYQAYRATVRAKIAAIRAAQADCTAEERAAAQADCRAHLRLAAELGVAPAPFLAITHGVTGTGKSTVTRSLLAARDCIRLRSDVERKRLFGLAADAASGSATGAGIYGAEATERTYARLESLARALLAAGWPVVADATFLQRDRREAFRRVAADAGVPFVILDFPAHPDTLRRRVEQRRHARGDASEATLEVLERQLQSDQPVAGEELAHCLSLPDDPAEAAALATARLAQETARQD